MYIHQVPKVPQHPDVAPRSPSGICFRVFHSNIVFLSKSFLCLLHFIFLASSYFVWLSMQTPFLMKTIAIAFMALYKSKRTILRTSSLVISSMILFPIEVIC